MKLTKLSTVALGLAAVTLTACPPPRVLISNNYIGDNKMAKSYLVQRGDDQKLFDYSVRVCDVVGSGANVKADNCKDTLVVDRVIR